MVGPVNVIISAAVDVDFSAGESIDVRIRQRAELSDFLMPRIGLVVRRIIPETNPAVGLLIINGLRHHGLAEWSQE